MQEQPTWEDIEREAVNLEIWFDDSAGAVWMEKYDSVCGWFQQSLARRQAAWTWLKQTRQAIEKRDQFRSLDPQRRRRMFLRWLWRRYHHDRPFAGSVSLHRQTCVASLRAEEVAHLDLEAFEALPADRGSSSCSASSRSARLVRYLPHYAGPLQLIEQGSQPAVTRSATDSTYQVLAKLSHSLLLAQSQQS